MPTTDHQHSEVIREAAKWLMFGNRDRSKTPIPELKERFGLSALQACEAIAESHLIRARAT